MQYLYICQQPDNSDVGKFRNFWNEKAEFFSTSNRLFDFCKNMNSGLYISFLVDKSMMEILNVCFENY